MRRRRRSEPYRFLQERRATPDDQYGALLERELAHLAGGPLYGLVHDDLAEFWEPVWFAQFAAHAARHGLDYVGEADLSDLRTASMPKDTEAEVWRLADGDRITYETCTDLLTRAISAGACCAAQAPR